MRHKLTAISIACATLLAAFCDRGGTPRDVPRNVANRLDAAAIVGCYTVAANAPQPPGGFSRIELTNMRSRRLEDRQRYRVTVDGFPAAHAEWWDAGRGTIEVTIALESGAGATLLALRRAADGLAGSWTEMGDVASTPRIEHPVRFNRVPCSR